MSNVKYRKSFFELPDFTELPLRVPKDLTLYPFQEQTVKKSLKFLSERSTHSCYVASEMGLGKSITSLVTANSMGVARTLIICPAIMRLVWEAEIFKWCRFNVQSVPRICTILTSSDVLSAHSASWVICSYSLASQKNVLAVLAKEPYDLLILDEAHAIKNKSASRTRAVIADLWPKCTYRLLLSGTPMTRNVVDCWVPFHNILPEKFPTFHEFVERYSYSRVTKWAIDYYGLKNAEELSGIIRENFYIRYKKEEVLTELPPKVWQKITLPDSYSIKVSARQAKELYEQSKSILDDITRDRVAYVPPTMAEHRRLQGSAKVPAVVEFVSDLLDQGVPTVIFAHHKAVVSALMEGLKFHMPVCITGETSATDRASAVEAFQAGTTNLFIGNFVAAGVGITLTRGCTVVLAELDWTPATINQAVDRLHRITQKNQVTVYYFIVRDSIDSTIEEIVINRTKDFNRLLDKGTEICPDGQTTTCSPTQ